MIVYGACEVFAEVNKDANNEKEVEKKLKAKLELEMIELKLKKAGYNWVFEKAPVLGDVRKVLESLRVNLSSLLSPAFISLLFLHLLLQLDSPRLSLALHLSHAPVGLNLWLREQIILHRYIELLVINVIA